MTSKMLPQPSATFTLPSLYDNLELDCRLYYPQVNDSVSVTGFAIFAHPYAPLGGSYNDHVVQMIGQLLSKSGLVLAIFNFRGAEGSPGKTSWSGKAEVGDYVSLYTFMLSFLNNPDVVSRLRPLHGERGAMNPLVILGGYSYGSMITAHLPNIDVVLEILHRAKDGDIEQEIHNRAQELAQSFLGWYESRIHRGRTSLQALDGAPSSSTSFGGYDSPVAARRISRDQSRRSLDRDRVRQSMDRVRRKLGGHDNDISEPEPATMRAADQPIQIKPRVAYLLVSPLLGPVSTFATMFSSPRFERRDRSATAAKDTPIAKIDSVLSSKASLVVFGSDDHFTSSRKVKQWCESLKARPGSKLQFREVADTGHFWHDERNGAILQSTVSEWLNVVIDRKDEHN